MTLEQLQMFVALEKTKSISKTAETLYVTHQAVSLAIKKLERELETTLLIRSTYGVDFTEDGLKLLAYAKQIILLMDQLYEAFGSTARRTQEKSVMLPVYATTRVVDSFLVPFLPVLKRTTAEISISIHEKEWGNILNNMRADKESVGVISCMHLEWEKLIDNNFLPEGMKYHIFVSLPMVAYMHKDSVWAKKECYYSRQFDNIPVIGYKSAWNVYTNTISDTEFLHELNSINLQKKLVLEKQGIGICSALEFKQNWGHRKTIVSKPIILDQGDGLDIILLYFNELSDAAKIFMKEFEKQFSKIKKSIL